MSSGIGIFSVMPAFTKTCRSSPRRTTSERTVPAFRHRLRVRYVECDAQGVVFNAHYLAYFDIGITELWREALGSYQDMLDAGVDVVVAEAGVRFRLRDSGTHGDPGKMHGRPLDLVQPGGLGLHLIRRAFHQVDYNLKKEGTELVLEKHFNHTTPRGGI